MKSKTNLKSVKARKPDKKVFSFFILAFPTILIVILATLLPAELWWATFLYIVIAVYQFLMLKQFLDNYYETML